MERPFDDVNILDMTHWLGRYVGRLFADLGAQVVRIEPLDGLPDRRELGQVGNYVDDPAIYEFEYLNASKLVRVMDVSSDEGRSCFRQLARSAQVVLLERGGPLYGELEWVSSVAPSAVVTSISPFGRTGPWADAPATDLTLQAAGGIAWLSGRLDGPPLRLPEGQATMITGVYAGVATSIALYDALATGRGHIVEVSTQECIAHSLQNSIQVWDFERKVSMRGGEGTRDASENVFACKDGLIFLAAPRTLGVSWNALVEWICETGHPASVELSHERWLDRVWRLTGEARARLRGTLESFFGQYTKEELTREAIRRKIVMAPVCTVHEVLADPQLQYQKYFQKLTLAHNGLESMFPGPPYRLSEPIWSVSPCVRLGQA